MHQPIKVRLQLFAQERTERATPRRRQDARRKGQVAKTAELSSALILLTVFGAIYLLASYAAREVRSFTLHMYEDLLVSPAATDPGQIPALLLETTLLVAKIVAPFLGVAVVAGVVTQVAQVGFLTALDPIKPQFGRLSPISGFKRIFSKRAVVELLKSTIKIVVVGLIAYMMVRRDVPTFLEFASMPALDAVILTGRIAFRVALWVALALLVLAAFDYMYQKWEFEQSIKMSKKEIRDELRQTEGDPQIRSKIRQRQRQIAGMRMMAQVPTADVVITNPVHLAVALRYDQREMEAPIVVAKGAGPLAAKIKETAKEHHVTVVENVWLARALYESAEVNVRIPEELYQAVAEVLAFVYRLRKAGGTA